MGVGREAGVYGNSELWRSGAESPGPSTSDAAGGQVQLDKMELHY